MRTNLVSALLIILSFDKLLINHLSVLILLMVHKSYLYTY